MNRGIVAGAILIALSAGAQAYSAPLPAPTPFPTLPPIPLTLAPIAPTAIPTATAPPTATASATPTQTSQTSQTSQANLRTSPTPSRAVSPQSPSPSPSTAPTNPAAGAPPGVYVTDLRTDPNPPNRTAELRFFASFANSTGLPQNYRWNVYIYRFDAPSRSTGEATMTQVNLPVGSSEQKVDGFWRLGPGNQCESFFARVASLDQDKKPTMLMRPDGKVFEKSMTLCP